MANGVYSEKEMKYMLKFQDFKGWIFKPVLVILTSLKINANHISGLSALTAISSLFLSIHQFDPRFFLIGIWIHIFFDSLDGPLARFQNKNSSLGSFIDVVCDHLGILTSGFYMLQFTNINPSYILMFIIFYTVDIYNLFITNYIQKPIAAVFRPRMLVYAMLFIDFYFFKNYTQNVLIFLNFILFIQCVSSFTSIAKYLKNN